MPTVAVQAVSFVSVRIARGGLVVKGIKRSSYFEAPDKGANCHPTSFRLDCCARRKRASGKERRCASQRCTWQEQESVVPFHPNFWGFSVAAQSVAERGRGLNRPEGA